MRRKCLTAILLLTPCTLAFAGELRSPVIEPEALVREFWHFDGAAGFCSSPIIANFANASGTQIGAASQADGAHYSFDKDGKVVEKSASQRAVTNFVAATARGAERPGMFAFEEADGRITLINRAENETYLAELEGAPVTGAGLLFADLNLDGIPNLLSVRANGGITVFDRWLTPRWQFDVGAPVCAPLAVAPVFDIASAVYVVTTDGVLHAFTGTGRSFWQFSPRVPDTHTTPDGPLVLQLAAERPSVLYTNDSGCLYAVDAIKGREQWHAQLDNAPLGTPGIVEFSQAEGRRIIVVSQKGQITVLDATGRIQRQASLPKGRYVPRPLVADVGGDNAFEILVANDQWEVLAASLDGVVRQTLSLRGNAAGMILADLEHKGYLDLLVTTDCARICRFATRATGGWTNPRANAALNGFLLPISVIPLPPQEKSRRAAHGAAVTVRGFVQQRPFSTAVVRPNKPRGARYASVIIRQEHSILGAAFKEISSDGTVAIPFVQTLEGSLLCDLSLYDRQGRLSASSMGIPVPPGRVKLVELPSNDSFVHALTDRADHYDVPRSGGEGKILSVGAMAPVQLGDDVPCGPLQMAVARGKARQSGGQPWPMTISPEYEGAASAPMPGLTWRKPHAVQGAACGHSASLLERLAIAGHLAGAAEVHAPDYGIPFTPVAFLLGKMGGRFPVFDALSDKERMFETRDASPYLSMFRHVFDWNGQSDFEWGFLTSGPYGEIFDVITADAAPATLKAYAVVWPLSATALTPTERDRLIEYVKGGGILVLDAATARRTASAGQFPKRLLEVTFADDFAFATQVQTALGTAPAASAPFKYFPMTVGKKSEALAWADTGQPLLAWTPVGAGMIITAATEHWLDVKGRVAPIASIVLRAISSAFLPVQPPPNVETFINKTPNGWLIGLINNAGVAKAPTLPPVVDPAGAIDPLLQFRGRMPLQFHSELGNFEWSLNEAGLRVHIPPGEAAVVKAVVSE